MQEPTTGKWNLKVLRRWAMTIAFTVFLALQLLILVEIRDANDQFLTEVAEANQELIDTTTLRCEQLAQSQEVTKELIVLLVDTFAEPPVVSEFRRQLNELIPPTDCDSLEG